MGTHAEHRKTKALERRFSAGSSGDAERRCYTEMEIGLNAPAHTGREASVQYHSWCTVSGPFAVYHLRPWSAKAGHPLSQVRLRRHHTFPEAHDGT